MMGFLAKRKDGQSLSSRRFRNRGGFRAYRQDRRRRRGRRARLVGSAGSGKAGVVAVARRGATPGARRSAAVRAVPWWGLAAAVFLGAYLLFYGLDKPSPDRGPGNVANVAPPAIPVKAPSVDSEAVVSAERASDLLRGVLQDAAGGVHCSRSARTQAPLPATLCMAIHPSTSTRKRLPGHLQLEDALIQSAVLLTGLVQEPALFWDAVPSQGTVHPDAPVPYRNNFHWRPVGFLPADHLDFRGRNGCLPQPDALPGRIKTQHYNVSPVLTEGKILDIHETGDSVLRLPKTHQSPHAPVFR